MSAHTPTPWKWCHDTLAPHIGLIVDAHDLGVVATHERLGTLIVLAVNSHASLLARVAELEADNARLRDALCALAPMIETLRPPSEVASLDVRMAEIQSDCPIAEPARAALVRMLTVDSERLQGRYRAARSALEGGGT